MPVRRRKWRPPRNYELLKVLRREAYLEQEGLCYWCGQKMQWKGWWQSPRLCTADHLVPRSEGGQTIRGNIVAACRDCNNRRCTKPRTEESACLSE